MKKPVIIMSARDMHNSSFGLTMLGNNDGYYQFIRQSGGLPLTFMATDEAEAEEAAALADGLLITGGADIDPALYGEENHGSSPGEARIDRSDLLLYQAFIKAHKPVLGICRGIQLIAAAEHATLIQDIPSYGNYLNHSQWTFEPRPAYNFKSHDCMFVKGSRLYEIFGEQYPVNSFHHQALKTVPAGYKETARSTDGLIEAIESELVTAVQWHPERLIDDPKHLAIGEMFIRMVNAQDR